MATIKSISALSLLLLAGVLTGCAQDPPPQTVDHVDLNRYAGKWYEVARIPHLYEYNCVAASESFTPTRDGELRVIHRCHQDETFGWLREDVGTARVVDHNTNAKLRVDMGPAGGDFWILALDPDYQYTMIGTPDRQSLWIMSRKAVLPPEVDDKLFRLADDMGYDIGKIRRTPQPMGL